MRLKFVADAVYNGEIVFKAGQEREVDDSKGYASRWIKRGVAVDVVEEKAKALTKAQEKAAKREALASNKKSEQDEGDDDLTSNPEDTDEQDVL